MHTGIRNRWQQAAEIDRDIDETLRQAQVKRAKAARRAAANPPPPPDPETVTRQMAEAMASMRIQRGIDSPVLDIDLLRAGFTQKQIDAHNASASVMAGDLVAAMLRESRVA